MKSKYAPGSVDVVTLEGDRLFVEPTGEPKVEIFPENEATFFAKARSGGWTSQAEVKKSTAVAILSVAVLLAALAVSRARLWE